MNKLVFSICLLTVSAVMNMAHAKRPVRAANIILIFADDLGYGDVACYGGKRVKTPMIDRLAEEGMRFTDFLIPANVCGPSRAALMTGRYPMRCGNPVFQGLDPKEVTFTELLKKAGYKNLLVGKWHLGFDVEGSHPLDSGFDENLGIASNYATNLARTKKLYRGRELIKDPVKFEELTTLYTDEAVAFIEREKDGPFFIMVSHHIPHLPLLPSKEFKGKSKLGVYADVVLELDHSTGRIMQALKDNGIDDNTLVVFTSDNGPAARGASGPLNGGKYVTMEGGHRVPAIFRWPGEIPEGVVSDTTVTSMDLFPLFCDLAGVDMPSDRKFDGKNMASILRGQTKESPHEFLYYYNGRNLQAVRRGKWKLHLPRTLADQPFWAKKAGGNKKKVHLTVKEPLLFDLDSDVGEKRNIAAQHPEIVASLLKEADRVRRELGDVDVVGSDQNPYGLRETR